MTAPVGRAGYDRCGSVATSAATYASDAHRCNNRVTGPPAFVIHESGRRVARQRCVREAEPLIVLVHLENPTGHRDRHRPEVQTQRDVGTGPRSSIR